MLGIKDLLQQAQNLQTKMAGLQEELAQRTVVGSSGGDMVTAEVNGAMEVVSLKIEKELLTGEDQELLEDLIIAAVNDGLGKARDMVAQEVSKLTGGLRIPGMF
ncbi:MAG: YbaB/EbfC family nucleoid-associated protein [Thermodesulfobacteriota bacterium]